MLLPWGKKVFLINVSKKVYFCSVIYVGNVLKTPLLQYVKKNRSEYAEKRPKKQK